MRIFLLLICLFFLVVQLPAQPSADSTVDFWSAVRPTHRRPADPEKIKRLTQWCQQQIPPADLACPTGLIWTTTPQSPQNWLYPALQSQFTATVACNEQRLRVLESRIGNVRDDRYLARLILRASFYVLRNEYSTARQYGQQAVQLADSLRTLQGWARLVQSRVLFGQETNFSLAYSFVNQALDMARAQHDPYLEANTLSMLGIINRRIYFGASLKALPYHQAALQMATARRDTLLMAQEIQAIGFNYEDAGRKDKFVEAMLQLVPLASKYARIKARLLVVVSRLLPDHSVTEQGLLLQKALQYSTLTGETAHLEYIYHDLYELSLANNRINEATQIAQRIDSLNRILAPHRSYSASTNLIGYQLAKQKGDKAGALAHLEKEYQNVSRRYQTQNATALSQWEAMFHKEEQDLQLKQREQQHTFLLIVIALVTLLLLTTAVALYFQHKSKRAVRRQMALTADQADQLRQVDALKTRFFANVSHELRTPLTLILGPLSSLLKRPPVDAESKEFLQTAQQNARRLLELVNEIMDLTKLEAGKLEVVHEPVSIHPLMSQIVANFESLAHQSSIQLDLVCDIRSNLLVELDRRKFQRILDNLLINAFKFTPANGRIVVKAMDKPGQIHIEVADTGRGIYPDDLPYVFDRYFQTTQPGSPSEGGTGIGLALAAEFTKLLGGELWVKSQWQHGTTFYLEIPKRVVTPEATPVALSKEESGDMVALVGPDLATSSDTPADSRKTLLLVEDDKSLRHYLMTVLQPMYTVRVAQNGQEALDQLAQLPTLPSLIISDLMMPILDGFQLLEALKRTDAYRHIPVVMLTARADKADKLQALRLGVDDYLLKPFDEDELMARVANLLVHTHLRQLQPAISADTADEPDPAPLMSRVDADWLKRLEQHTQNQLGQFDLTADQLADLMAVSRSTLFREVKRLTGLTPAQYLTEARLQQARLLLENRQVASVKALAQRVGLRQVKHFSLTFRNRFGKLPSEYL